jgi:hypothetical protein
LAEEADAPAAPVQVPWWVRVCLFGVVDRRVAMVFYWVFAAMLILGPLLMLSLTSPLGSAQRLTAALVTLGGAAFSLWSTARAVRWADRFGWDLLP